MPTIDAADYNTWTRPGVRGSEARIIAGRNPEEWANLRAIKLGLPPLIQRSASAKRLMMMGSLLEPMIVQEASEAITLRRTHTQLCKAERQLEVMHPEVTHFQATLDLAYSNRHNIIEAMCEAKFHTGDQDIDSLAEYYGPQLNHQLFCAGMKSCDFAVLFGHYGNFRMAEVERDDDWLGNYAGEVIEFIIYVETGELPKNMGVPMPAPAIVAGKKIEWTVLDNQPTVYAQEILELKPQAEKFEAAKDNIKALVPADVAQATWTEGGRRVRLTRNKHGSLTLTVR